MLRRLPRASAAVALAALAALGCAGIARDAGVLRPRGSCAVAPIVRDRAPGCSRLAGRAVVAPSLDPGAAAAAFDGDVCRAWNSGGPAPRWIGVDFGEIREVSGVMLVPQIKESPAATHIIEASEDGETFRPLVVLSGEMVSAEGHAVRFEPAIRARQLRVSTTQGDRIVWREIVPLACGG